jgi:hypothetical protein
MSRATFLASSVRVRSPVGASQPECKLSQGPLRPGGRRKARARNRLQLPRSWPPSPTRTPFQGAESPMGTGDCQWGAWNPDHDSGKSDGDPWGWPRMIPDRPRQIGDGDGSPLRRHTIIRGMSPDTHGSLQVRHGNFNSEAAQSPWSASPPLSGGCVRRLAAQGTGRLVRRGQATGRASDHFLSPARNLCWNVFWEYTRIVLARLY